MNDNTILIKNALILSPNTNFENKQSILIKDNLIAEISPDIDESNVSKIIDATGKILLPGLINTHTHLSMTLFRGLADDLSLDSWLNDYIWPMEANLNGDYCYIGALLGAVELIKSGTTTFSDMYFYMEDVARAVDESGIRAVLSYGMIDFGDEDKRKNEINENLELFKSCEGMGNGRIKVFLGPHSPYTASEELLIQVRELADEYDMGIHIHVSETQKEIVDISSEKGLRPFEYLDKIGFLGPDVVAAHCVWLSDNEIEIIKKNNVKISHNPCSNMKLASGIAPVSKLIENDICVSIGTDGASSNNNLDLIEELKTASLLQKVSTLDPKVLTSDETLSMGTIKGAETLGLESEIGSIEVGKKADIILIDTNSANMIPDSSSLSSNIIYSANGLNVDTTICDGKILMENKKLTVLDEGEIYQKARQAIKELKEAI
ncbi:5-methylthioadenosine/S-adenosylhomocysteine deaminase [Methanobrevibacter gottschalkii]|uniref:5'-deoxyadenosine deaminase n=2 Tax=Methanobrevibacter gottschalkii TaxID=190974 RepID=A0A3N5B6Y0_9EURY|nr:MULTISPECIES: amidohydrolase family protein [Methanobrevibacter]MCQ2971226.1 amidohydrolase family protein [archaeon]OEC93740.1 N-ethylammeline chlorohydrolase [Methanobrevibacter sp. A27]RPF52849.1 5-methylthioadenosine/S-adenosylhomocysteine deaminase [Methanobrevibacter gottschalkii DSM 11977]SEK19292.1 5-methylthioadenosine/S-adenosylhomocysteine deaminase [Methanobrevibacter gottschalkii]